MGIWKRLFGRGDAETDERTRAELEQVQAGEISKIYPVIKPGDWIGVKAGSLRQTLVGSPEEPKLVLGFAYDAPTNLVFIQESHLKDKDPEAILAEAYENLEAYPQEFEVSTHFDGRILLASGQDFSSEKILCRTHMLKAHQLLQSEELLVSIPRRRCLMITSRQADETLLSAFVELHLHAWEDDSYGNAPIINALFVVVNGEIQGLIPL